jgi:hypothetical protein
MTDKELVKRLRKGDTPMANHYMDEAADRIEALTAKLAKAVEALHTISSHAVLNNENDEELSASALIARATLAEIEGSNAP